MLSRFFLTLLISLDLIGMDFLIRPWDIIGHLLLTYVFLFMNCCPNCVEAGVDDFVFLSVFKFLCVFGMLVMT